MANVAHSKKALETLNQMGAAPEAFVLTPIKWVEEERVVRGMVRCPECLGGRFVLYNEAGEVVPAPARVPYSEESYYEVERARREHSEAARKQAWNTNHQYGNCRKCQGRQRGYWVAKGEVPGLVKAKVMVGYPQFPEGTKMDSRFAHNGQCHLCAKAIVEVVPVHGADAQGQVHGMLVGTDCAKKFLGNVAKVAKAKKGMEQMVVAQ